MTEDDADPYALSNRFVYPVLKDHEGGVWIGTFYGGVNYLSPGAGQFEWYHPVSNGNSVSGAVISGFCEDNDGDIWIASDDGGLNRFSPHGRHFTHYLPDKKNPAGSLSFAKLLYLLLIGMAIVFLISFLLRRSEKKHEEEILRPLPYPHGPSGRRGPIHTLRQGGGTHHQRLDDACDGRCTALSSHPLPSLHQPYPLCAAYGQD